MAATKTELEMKMEAAEKVIIEALTAAIMPFGREEYIRDLQRRFGRTLPRAPDERQPKKTWGDYHREALAAGMDDASACHAADTAVP